MGVPLRVLLLTDDKDEAARIAAELREGSYEPSVHRVESVAAFEKALEDRWDVVLAEYSVGNFEAMQALRRIQELALDLPLIVISGQEEDAAISEVLKAGAADVVPRGSLLRLNGTVGREISAAKARRERIRMEEQLWHAQKMEAVGRLAGGMAHDFNNLLTVITGYSDLLLSGHDLKENHRSALQEVRRAAERGGALTQQLLTFSRRQPLAKKNLHLNDLILNLQKMIRRLIGEDIEMVTLPSATSDVVEADQGRLEQVIMNLVVNARDAMPRGGKLILETATVNVSPGFAAEHINLKPGQHAMLAITDTGIGMDPETQRHAFEPFFTTKSAGKGTGLGLATAYAIIQQSGGSISLHSAKEKGTTIKIYLPLVSKEVPEAAEKQAPREDVPSGKETILVVEDELRVRKLICDVLTARGYEVLEATRGDEALRLCVSHKGSIDLAIVDVVMPEMSGPEAVQQISAMRPEAKVLYISGYSDEVIVHHGIQETDAAFLQKPFMPDALARKVRQVLDDGQPAEANGR